MSKNWYIVHVYSGFEQRVKSSLEERIKQAAQAEKFEEILIPAETVVEMKKGEKKARSKKFFPGYIFVKMELDNESWHLVKHTPKVTGFVGDSTNPPSVSEAEVLKITQQIKEGKMKPRLQIDFEKGENVRVKEGPFANFNGVVDEVLPDKGRLKVLVSIFGRSTPIDLEFGQVEKA
ncbi:MAG: transcription termination/antitermination protein NusG [Deltaproteobacteria bacterium CG11_big_fil_rev_8_21_14_0_20_45_16]|nr:MAG: transcription termination/antitermination protein NusG [Deltaproteobacteria bacterium CG11_big_fil_rev_8_21_14_0_20_45_16]